MIAFSDLVGWMTPVGA